MGDQPFVRSIPTQDNESAEKTYISIARQGIEHAILVFEWAKTFRAFDRSVTVSGFI
jgi:hypothetical protein